MRVFQYIGTGACVPGIPNRLTEKEAIRMGIMELLTEAIKGGQFEEVKQYQVKAPVMAPRPTAERKYSARTRKEH